MDRGGLEICMALVGGSRSFRRFPTLNKRVPACNANDYLAENIVGYPKHLKGFAALPQQDPQAAAQERPPKS
jgi:predicted TIM-barrel fold metal-dependent hydrolase